MKELKLGKHLLLHLKGFAPAAAVVLFRRPGVVVLLAIYGRLVCTACFVGQVQGRQLCLVVVEERLQSSDFDVVLAAHNRYFCVWKCSYQENTIVDTSVLLYGILKTTVQIGETKVAILGTNCN